MGKAMNRSSGITLIELMFSLAVIAVIFVVAFAHTQKATLQSNVGMIQGSVISLMNSLERYYYQNCQDPSSLIVSDSDTGDIHSISVRKLVDYGVNLDTIGNPYAPPPQAKGGRNSFTMYIDQNVTHPDPTLPSSLYSILEVQVEFNPKMTDEMWNTLLGLLNPSATGKIDDSSAKAMRWTELPVSQDVSGLSSLSAYYQLYAKDVYSADPDYQPASAAQPCASYELGVPKPGP